MKIAILGYGTVGSGVGEIVMSNATKALADLEVAYILEKKENLHKHPLMCDDMERILKDESIDVIVETMGGIEPAHTFIIKALRAKKHVVSANKAVIAKYLKEFHDCADAHGVKFLYEASCGGGIPWIHQLWNTKRIDEIDEIHGIFNGTSNYILDHMEKEHAPFDEVLHKAQELGYAEFDPSADIDGFDIQNKLKISCAIAFDCDVPEYVPVSGIRNIRKEDIDFAASLHKTIKLMAKAKRVEHRYFAVVEPVLYDKRNMEAAISENFNLTCLHGATIGDLRFYGQGAGKLPTAHAIVQDILDLQNPCVIPTLHMDHTYTYDPSLLTSAYMIRTSLAETQIREILKEAFDHIIAFHGTVFTMTRIISADHMHQLMKEIMNWDPYAFIAAIHQEGLC